MTWVLEDWSANQSSELTVIRGQQIEVIEPPPTTPKPINDPNIRDPNEWVYVRLSHAHDREGWVPLSVLKQPPKQHLRNDLELSGEYYIFFALFSSRIRNCVKILFPVVK